MPALRRRDFISLLGGAAAAWPLAAGAQQSGKIVSIGILAFEAWPPIDAFRQALNDLGYVEGKNVRFEHRYAKGRNERFPDLANDLVGLKVDVILTWGTEAVLADPFLVSQRSRIAQFAIENRLPSAYTYREHAEAGGLIAYTPNYHDLFRRAATYVDKILKGTKPGELPIEQPTKFDLVINLNPARALGLTVPLTLQAAADEVIE